MERVSQRELGLLQQYLIGGERRIFERDVQNFEQVFGAKARCAHVFALIFSQRRFEQQIRHPEDPAERRADLVIQAGEELPLYFPKLIRFQRDTA